MIKIADVNDIPELKRMALLFKDYSPYKDFPTDNTKLEETIYGLIQESPLSSVVLIAEVDGKAIGMIAGVAREFLWSRDKHATEIVWWVDEEHRAGPGKELNQVFVHWAKKIGCKYLHMTALENEDKKNIVKIYKKLKFKPLESAFIKEI
jgi:hypothetical protein